MRIQALDHVNIVTDDLDASSRFYADAFGLEPRDGPMPRDLGRWLYDGAGRAIIHLNSRDCPRHFDRAMDAGPTGALHHVALSCTGFDDIRSRLEANGFAFEENYVAAAGIRQLFVKDPNEVLFELNFADA